MPSLPTMPTFEYAFAQSGAPRPAWLCSELQRANGGQPLERLLGAALWLRHEAPAEPTAMAALLQGKPPPLDPLRRWFAGLRPVDLEAIDDQATLRSQRLEAGLARLRKKFDLGDPKFTQAFIDLACERDRLEGVRVLLAWRQSEADRDPEQQAELRRVLARIAAAKDAKLAKLTGKPKERQLEQWWPRAPRQAVERRVELLQVTALNRALRGLDSAMLAWLESLHRHPLIEDPWLQAVAEQDPLAWWGAWSVVRSKF